MANKPTYWELLRHPSWQRKRLEVMERAGFKCEECGTDEVTLNVHHQYYTKGAKPWEYPDEALKCLCENCHQSRHAAQEELKMVAGSLTDFDINRVIGYAWALLLLENAGPDNDGPIPAGSYERICGIADAYRLTGNEGVVAVGNAAGPDGKVAHSAIVQARRLGFPYGINLEEAK